MISGILNWISQNEQLIQQTGNASLVILAITVVALPLVVKMLPANYFISEKREPARQTRKHPLLWALLSLLKNLLGLLLILVGIAMLVLPGQGTVTLLIGLAISNFPGKYAIERRIVCQPAVGDTLNKIRKLTNSPPLMLPMKDKEQQER
jgi:hypothetical protein